MFRKLRLITIPMLAALTLGLSAAAAQADPTVQLGQNCSVTAHAPLDYYGYVLAQTSVSCGGSHVNWTKEAFDCLQVMGQGGLTWYNVAGCDWSSPSSANPTIVSTLAPGVPGHVYRTVSYGLAYGGGIEVGGGPAAAGGYTFP